MFYPRFAKLSGSSDPAIVRALDRLLAHVWRDGYRTIGHTYVARELAIGDEVAADLLLEAADLGIVAAKFDLRCPHCGHVVAVSSIRDVPVADHECPNCWQTFTPSQDDLFISFEVLSPPEGEVGRKKAERGGTCPPPSAEAVSFDTLVETSSYFRQHFAPGVLFHLPSADKYQSLLERCFTEWEATSKGEALEDLARYLLDAVNVFRFKKRDHDTLTGELDLIYGVVPVYPFADWGKWLVVECRNRSERVGAPQIDNFAAKIERAGASVGLLIAPEGITGPKGQNAQGAVGFWWQKNRIRIITLTKADLQAVASGENFCLILETRELEVCFPAK